MRRISAPIPKTGDRTTAPIRPSRPHRTATLRLPSGCLGMGASLPLRTATPVLAPEQSAILRERLVAQLADVRSADDAATWAHRNCLPRTR